VFLALAAISSAFFSCEKENQTVYTITSRLLHTCEVGEPMPVLYAVADQPLFTDLMQKEIFEANPHCTRDQEFMEYLATKFPAYLRAISRHLNR
jgi:hypothetical protein